MRCRIVLAPLVFLALLFAGCNDSEKLAEAARKAADARTAEEKAERERLRGEQERLAAEQRLQEALNKDFEQLLGHWDHPGGMANDGKRLPSIHLEIDPQHVARFGIAAGSAASSNEYRIRLNEEGGQRFLLPDGEAAQRKLTPLAYRLDGDSLTITGSASDILLNRIDLSGTWQRTDWTRKTEAEIADELKKLNAILVYDEDSPTKPIVKVGFHFRAPVHDAHLRLFAGLKRLQELDLSMAANVDEAGFVHLAELKQLKQLNLSSVAASNEALQKLARELPNCRIVR